MPYPLKTYIHDHLAGAALAIELLETLLTTPLDQPLREFLMGLRAEVVEDRDQLETLAKATNLGESAVKEAAAWFSEKLSRVKIGAGGADAFEIFEALEFIELGIRGKLQMWRALETISNADRRLKVVDLEVLTSRAEKQYAEVEGWRLLLAEKALIQD